MTTPLRLALTRPAWISCSIEPIGVECPGQAQGQGARAWQGRDDAACLVQIERKLGGHTAAEGFAEYV